MEKNSFKAAILLLLTDRLTPPPTQIGKRRKIAQDSDSSGTAGGSGGDGGCRLAAQIARDVLLNPIVLMTTLGVVGNFIFDHQLPDILQGILKVGLAPYSVPVFLPTGKILAENNELPIICSPKSLCPFFWYNSRGCLVTDLHCRHCININMYCIVK